MRQPVIKFETTPTGKDIVEYCSALLDFAYANPASIALGSFNRIEIHAQVGDTVAVLVRFWAVMFELKRKK